ncbi:MAG: GNAT family N-acetyltransferase [Pseudomonadota bacterium]
MVTLRAATPADRPQLDAWEDEPHVQQAGIGGWDWAEMLREDPPWRSLLIAMLGDRPIGLLQIIDPAREDSQYWGDCGPGLRAIDIWIGPPDCLRQGHGRSMMTQAIARCFAAPDVGAILIDPLANNLSAHRFYRAMGFHPVGPRRFGTDDCLVFRLNRADWRAGD